MRKVKKLAYYSIYLALLCIICDVVVFRRIMGYGYPSHFKQENVHRHPAPYVEFVGNPDYSDHNELGFKGKQLSEAAPTDIKVAFFGGSTGYNGDPTIADVVEEYLNNLCEQNVHVSNFSVVSSGHRQHLHYMLEYLPKYKPDIIVFYGGCIETLQAANYDPRPGYPYNYFYRGELSPFRRVLLRNSAVLGAFDMKYGFISGISDLREKHKPKSEEWIKRITAMYFETLSLAKQVSGAIESRRFGNSQFIAFFQPFMVPDDFKIAHRYIRNKCNMVPYVHDYSRTYDIFEPDIFWDIAHVKQPAKNLMGQRIANEIYKEFILNDSTITK